ncbi:MAG: hypothetical protein RL671_2101, partial [Pseudomonadota bacterium]
GIVARLKKRLLPTIAALGHMVRDARQDKAGEANHTSSLM